MDKDYGCSASVTFTIGVTGDGHWGEKATVAEVQRMGGQEVINKVENALRIAGVHFVHVEKPKVGVITWGPVE